MYLLSSEAISNPVADNLTVNGIYTLFQPMTLLPLHDLRVTMSPTCLILSYQSQITDAYRKSKSLLDITAVHAGKVCQPGGTIL
jgi:hypothetical protein